MKLLAPTIPSELPTEALLARLRGRRAATFAADGASAEAVTDWVCRRLNSRLRRELTPCLELLAMRTLVLALRHALGGDEPAEALRRDRLLAQALHRLTMAGYGADTLVSRLEEALFDDYPFAVGLARTHRQQGPGGVEQQLVAGLLRHGLAWTRNATVRWLLHTLIDLRNGLAVMKHWQWQVARTPDFIPGGLVPETVLQRAFANGDRERLAQALGAPGATRQTAALERALLAKLTRGLRRKARDPLGLAVIIDFLWHAQLATHDRALRRAPSTPRGERSPEALLL